MTTPTAKDIAQIVGYVGDIVGRTKLQKTVAILELSGLGPGFSYSYHFYGPYSEELTSAVDRAVLLGLMEEQERVAAWGGRYSVYHAPRVEPDLAEKREMVQIAAGADSLVLELAVTAAFIADKEPNAWAKLVELKPEKATAENLQRARELYGEFKRIRTPRALPELQ